MYVLLFIQPPCRGRHIVFGSVVIVVSIVVVVLCVIPCERKVLNFTFKLEPKFSSHEGLRRVKKLMTLIFKVKLALKPQKFWF